MKNLKLVISVLLAGSMLLTAACGGKNNDEVTDFEVGRYVETDITPPINGRFSSYLSAEGSIVCFSEGLTARFESADGGANWTETPGPGGNTERYMSAQDGTMLDDGSLLVFVQGEGLEIVAPDGSARKYPVKELDDAIASGENVSLSMTQALGDRLIISYMIGGFVQLARAGDTPGGGARQNPGRQGNGLEAEPGSGGGYYNQANEPGGGQDAPGDGSQNSPQGGTPRNQPQDGSQDGNPQGSAENDAPAGDSSEVSGEEDATPGMPGRQPGGTTSGSASPMQMNSKTLLCDLESGQLIAEMQVENASAAVARNDTFYLMDSNGSVSTYNLIDGASTGKPAIRFGGADIPGGFDGPGGARNMSMRMPGVSGGVLALGSEGNLYSVLDGALMLADPEGNVSTALESSQASIGAPRSTVSSILALSDGSIVANMLESYQNNRLYKYTWNENAVLDPEKTLTIWSLSDNYFIRAAIAELRKKHADSLINYEIATDGDSGITASDAIKTLNSQLISGEGPDIILLDGCSVDSYADRGMLLDLSGLVDTGDVFDSLLDVYGGGGKTYCLPTQFYMPMLMGSPEALAEVKSLDDLVNLVVSGNDLPASGVGGPRMFSSVEESERSALYFNNLSELCDTLWASCAPAIVKDNQLDTDALRRYLEAVKSISDKYALTETSQNQGRRTGMNVAFSDGGVATQLPGSLMWYTMQLTNYAAFSAGNLQLLQMMMDRVGSTLELFPGLTPGAWQPSTVVGISADAKNPQFAAELVQGMLSVDIQGLNYGTGLPVTRDGLQAQVDAINERRAENDEEPFSFDPNVLVDRLSSPSIRDTILTDMMWTSVEKCCNGEIDIEGAVRDIEQNVKNYLAERS
ncbi:MAG: extracellular solute-binding protein [Oscillospiraceae bacterium]|nr:extracellular solute-binding protein [Oscillospiraceae bacterium]